MLAILAGTNRPGSSTGKVVRHLEGIYPERVFIRRCMKVFDAEGKITDPDIVKRLAAQAEGFLKFADMHAANG